MNAHEAYPMNRRFTQLAEEYEAWFESHKETVESEIAAVERVMPKGYTRALEVGVGTGRFAEALGIQEGVEPAEGMAHYAKKRGITVMLAEAESLPFEDSTFDLITMVTVLSFLRDPEQALSEVRRILTNEGAFVLAFLDRATPLGRVYDARKEENPFYRGVRFFTAHEVDALLHDTGFTVVERAQTVYTKENKAHDVREGNGEGVFAVLRAVLRA